MDKVNVLKAYQVPDIAGVYALLPTGAHVCFASMQARAISLAHALIVDPGGVRSAKKGLKVAVIGGGVSGVTVAIALEPWVDQVHIFDEQKDVLRVQSGADFRHVFRYMYAWPDEEIVDRAKEWVGGAFEYPPWFAIQSGTAQKFAEHLRARLDALLEASGNNVPRRLHVVKSALARVVGLNDEKAGGRVVLEVVEKDRAKVRNFDVVIVATGFPSDSRIPGTMTPGYWQRSVVDVVRPPRRVLTRQIAPNPQLMTANPQLKVGVVGSGDGAIYDAIELAYAIRNGESQKSPYRSLVEWALSNDVARRYSRMLGSGVFRDESWEGDLGAAFRDHVNSAGIEKQHNVTLFTRTEVGRFAANPLNQLLARWAIKDGAVCHTFPADVQKVVGNGTGPFSVRYRGSKRGAGAQDPLVKCDGFHSVICRAGIEGGSIGRIAMLTRVLPHSIERTLGLRGVFETVGRLDERPTLPRGSAFVLERANVLCGRERRNFALSVANLTPLFVRWPSGPDAVESRSTCEMKQVSSRYVADYPLVLSDLDELGRIKGLAPEEQEVLANIRSAQPGAADAPLIALSFAQCGVLVRLMERRLRLAWRRWRTAAESVKLDPASAKGQQSDSISPIRCVRLPTSSELFELNHRCRTHKNVIYREGAVPRRCEVETERDASGLILVQGPPWVWTNDGCSNSQVGAVFGAPQSSGQPVVRLVPRSARPSDVAVRVVVEFDTRWLVHRRWSR